ncbi:hypothetical protein H112_00472 [Trichophyton rubrum D6]|uniref:Uncharacterized protein n=2 Tax=Trichophyton TaxID=5550 RepID=A0A022WFR8_TRIRU|nr:hypothetical protein H100_00471 [Trichophyton rubrum MR850]EZF46597.1 hypothetical protein H102_00471 [Trichophyton rubrum CBS 100081]EZF57240.1 hypothetical protein H103_00471 [Trichophyton rubrum CBS 288.86]EZF67845.1 hypothetical protein H104_00461 [Trichophyton rubrum CBS 289.86]EZF78548.1 hypothetical protein H105_00459 [Trichophyton soudanense CBS 452.61]EZF89186.1 hypothetical protein H110_00475 [Trichophyton rubrum MR1448]EZF99977.1 hypothetical protein H113_00476 [Trichophyton rub
MKQPKKKPTSEKAGLKFNLNRKPSPFCTWKGTRSSLEQAEQSRSSLRLLVWRRPSSLSARHPLPFYGHPPPRSPRTTTYDLAALRSDLTC